MSKKCPWCVNPKSEEEGLCNMHEAERLGMTQADYEAALEDWL